MTTPEMLQDCEMYLRDNTDEEFNNEFQLMNTYYGNNVLKK